MNDEDLPSPSSRKSLKDHFSSSRSSNESIQIKWENLTYSTLTKDSENSTLSKPVYKHKQILKSLNGQAQSGQLIAVMGPTGCGKTSLLNVLAARVSTGNSSSIQLGGTISVNGKVRDDEKFRRLSAYVLQDDYLYANLTVLETLSLAAQFFMPTSTTKEEKDETVQMILSELGLIKAQDTIIGNEKIRGVSGGERKRTSIAVQLISDPAVFFLDEPTSGLDAFQAQSVMEAMKILADSNRLVITVIHQPRSSIFNMFDKLLLLSEGSTMYFGDAAASVPYFASQGFPCPESFNPSDFFLDLLSPDSRTSESDAEALNRIALLGQAWISHYNSLPTESASTSSGEIKELGTGFEIKRVIQNFSLLCWRTWTEQSRDVATLRIKFITTCVFGLIVGGIYSNIGHSQKSIQNRIGLLFFVVINQTFNGIISVLNAFPREKTIVNRERSGRAYDTLSYFCAKVFVEIPLNVIPPIIFSCILYWLVELNPKTFGYFILILMLQSLTAVSLGLAISSFAPSVEAAVAFGPIFVIIGILFGGFYININSLPIVANWIPYLSSLRWGFEALAINEFSGLSFECGNLPPSACVTSGEQVLANLDFTGHTTAYPVFGLGMLLLAYLAGAFFILHFNRLTYLPMGHTGSKVRNHISHQSPMEAKVEEKSPEIEMVAQVEHQPQSEAHSEP